MRVEDTLIFVYVYVNPSVTHVYFTRQLTVIFTSGLLVVN